MTAKPGLEAFLVRAVLDEDFRSIAQADPDLAIQGFDLTEPQKAIIRRRDGGMLSLLGEVLWSRETAAVDGVPETLERRPALSFVPEATLLLRILSSAADAGEDKLHVSYGATLHLAPDDADLVEAAAQLPKADALPGAALPDVTIAIHITPDITLNDAGELQVSFSAALQSLASPGSEASATTGKPGASAACRTAGAAVLAAPKEERIGKILDLIATLEQDPAANG